MLKYYYCQYNNNIKTIKGRKNNDNNHIKFGDDMLLELNFIQSLREFRSKPKHS